MSLFVRGPITAINIYVFQLEQQERDTLFLRKFERKLAPGRGWSLAAFDSPFLVFAIGFIVQVVAAYLGDRLRRRVQAVWKEERPEYDILRTAALKRFSAFSLGSASQWLLAGMISAKTWRKLRQMP